MLLFNVDNKEVEIIIIVILCYFIICMCIHGLKLTLYPTTTDYYSMHYNTENICLSVNGMYSTNLLNKIAENVGKD